MVATNQTVRQSGYAKTVELPMVTSGRFDMSSHYIQSPSVITGSSLRDCYAYMLNDLMGSRSSRNGLWSIAMKPWYRTEYAGSVSMSSKTGEASSHVKYQFTRS